MIRRNDPRIRQTLNQITQNLESANETAQTTFYTFTQRYISPCLASIGACFEKTTAPCFPSREERLRRKRGRSRGRPELNFDFYDDWDEEESAVDGIFGWGHDELDRLLAASSAARSTQREQPKRQRAMSYGSRGRRTTILNREVNDPTIIPKSSFLGFLEKLPWKIGGRGMKYRPSAADLQEHPGSRRLNPENEPLIERDDEEYDENDKSRKRQRSGTASSRETNNSLSSRGDLFPSDGEDDAVPIDDEFATALAHRPTGLSSDDRSSGMGQKGKKPVRSRASTRTKSSGETKSLSISSDGPDTEAINEDDGETPTLNDLKKEEERLEQDEERAIALKREAARRLAQRRGLSDSTDLSKSGPTPESDSGKIVSSIEEVPTSMSAPDSMPPEIDFGPIHTSDSPTDQLPSSSDDQSDELHPSDSNTLDTQNPASVLSVPTQEEDTWSNYT